MKTIDLEAHFYTKAVFDYLQKRDNYPKFVKLPEQDSYNLRFTEHISLFQSQTFIDALCMLQYIAQTYLPVLFKSYAGALGQNVRGGQYSRSASRKLCASSLRGELKAI